MVRVENLEVEKRGEKTQKRCEIIDIEEFPNENSQYAYIFLKHSAVFMDQTKFKIWRCEKRCENVQKKCAIVYIDEFSYEYPRKTYSCGT